MAANNDINDAEARSSLAAPFDFVLGAFDGAADEVDLIVEVVLRVTFDNVVSSDVAIEVVDDFWTEDDIGASEVDATVSFADEEASLIAASEVDTTVSFAEDEASVVAASEVVAADSSAEDVASVVATDDLAAADDVDSVVETDDFAAADDVTLVVNSSLLLSDNVDNVVVT